MKRISLILAAAALVLGLSQCKKQEQEPQASTGGTVAITLEVKAPAGQRIDVNTTTGDVKFEQGDVVHVGDGSKYVGTLTYKGTTFKGNLTNPTENQPLYFYFLGNKAPTFDGTTCTVDISDQTQELPVISFAESNENFTGPGLYTAYFLNKAALVEFDLANGTSNNVVLRGMKTVAMVDFVNSRITSANATGDITLYADPTDNTKKWAILLPQDALDGAEVSIIGTTTTVDVPAITENAFVQGAQAVKINNTPPVVPVGAISGKFSVSATEKVHFSKGNLQYIGSAATPYWQFAENQWDFLGTTTGQNSDSPTVNRDLFGWGTSGYNYASVAYQPWSISTTATYGPTSGNLSVTDKSDWGFNAISNGGNTANSSWRTLTTAEWQYVFNTRTTSSGIRYAKATVNNVSGMILLPDDWSTSTYTLSSFNTTGASFSSNTIDANAWRTLEDAGAVFLPAAGLRDGTTVDLAGSYGYYWSASPYGSTNAYRVSFNDGFLYPGNYLNRFYGFCVRLVCPAEN